MADYVPGFMGGTGARIAVAVLFVLSLVRMVAVPYDGEAVDGGNDFFHYMEQGSNTIVLDEYKME